MSTSNDQSIPAYIQTFRTFSLIMSAAMEFLGYSYTAIKQRQKSEAATSESNNFLVGSKAEGISLSSESDLDNMAVLPGCICVDGIKDAVEDRCQLLLLAKMDSLYPGYTKLNVPIQDDLRMRLPVTRDILECSFETNKGGVYLSSVLFNNRISKLMQVDTEITGPSQCYYSPISQISIDTVVAIRYQSKILLQEWLARPRCHGWPSEDSLREVAKLDWHLVPVGPKQADDDYQYWRICFTLGELYLVKTFNITQLHLLILLKYIMYKSLKPVCSVFSSYLAKNLVFWVVEILSPENFKPENICSLLMMSIQMLQQAVENEQLNNYMIPSRNLLKEKMSPDVKNNIIHILGRFIEAGPGFIMNNSEFSKLQEAMKKVNDDPEFSQQELKRNIRYEKMFLDWSVFVSHVNREESKKKIQSYPDFEEWKRISEHYEKIRSEYKVIHGLNFTDAKTRLVGLFKDS